MRAETSLFGGKGEKKAQRTRTGDLLPNSQAVLRPLELFRVRLSCVCFILFRFLSWDRWRGREEELLGSPEDSVGCHLNLALYPTLHHTLTPIGPHGNYLTVPRGVTPESHRGDLWQSVMHTQGHSLPTLGPDHLA